MSISNSRLDVEKTLGELESCTLPHPIARMPKFVPRQRKHKVRKRLEQGGDDLSVRISSDSNAAEILPVTVTEKEKKRQDLKNALRVQQPKASSKKQKRLDKYIVRSIPLQIRQG